MRGLTAVVVTIVVLAAGGTASAASPTETVKLKAAGSPVTGTVTAGAAGKGTRVAFHLRGLSPRAPVRGVFQAGTCAHPSASFADAGSAKSDGSGRAAWTSTIRFRGVSPVPWKAAADGEHLIAVVVRGKVVACGVIPGMS